MNKLKISILNIIISCFLIICVIACVPVVRDEFISPTWKGKLISAQSLVPISDISVKDYVSSIGGTTDELGEFNIPAVVQTFHLKVPAYLGFKEHQLDVKVRKSLSLSIIKTVKNMPSDEQIIDLGSIFIDENPNMPVNYSELEVSPVELDPLILQECGSSKLKSLQKLLTSLYKAKQSLYAYTGSNRDELDLAFNEHSMLIKSYWSENSQICSFLSEKNKEALKEYKEGVFFNLSKLAN